MNLFPEILCAADLAFLCGKSCLLMVSGGPDSLFLFHAFLQARSRGGPDFAVLHAHHHLRKAAADDDARTVEEVCRMAGIVCHTVHGHFNQSSGIPQQARRWRYREALRVMAESQHDILVTAHHADDQLETLILRARRGSGLKGLGGIRRLSLRGRQQGKPVWLLRPLLKFTKANLLQTLTQKNITYCVDATNSDTKYQRNRVRALLKNQEPAADQRVQILGESVALQLLDQFFTTRLRNLQNSHHVKAAEWQLWSEEIRFRWCWQGLHNLGCKTQLERRHLHLLEKQSKLQLGAVTLLMNEDGITLRPLQPLIEKMSEGTEFAMPAPGCYWWGQQCMLITVDQLPSTRLRQAGSWECEISPRRFPLTLRPCRRSQELFLAGRVHSMTLAKACTARGLRRAQWPDVVELADASGQVLCIPGVGALQTQPKSEDPAKKMVFRILSLNARKPVLTYWPASTI